MDSNPPRPGPSLQTYVETRFNLMGAEIVALRQVMDTAFRESDLRYQQRFDAQAKALEAAFQAAKEAVQAALSAADRAVSKAELAADKRFEALNELRQMLTEMVANLVPKTEAVQRFDAIGEKIDALSRRIDTQEGRLNTAAGEAEGGRRIKDDTKTLITVGISFLVLIILAATFIIARAK